MNVCLLLLTLLTTIKSYSLKNLLLLALLLFTSELTAQNYRNICSPGNMIYRSGEQFKEIRVDSVQPLGNNDSLFITFPTIRNTGSSCYDTTGGSILGRRILAIHDGTFLFFNYLQDTICIRTQAALNESWKLVNLPDKSYLEATLTTIAVDTFAAVPDSVKVITIQAKDSLGQNIVNLNNGKEVNLSKSFGFTRIFDLDMFPWDSFQYTLAGRTNPGMGIQAPGKIQVYDYNIGDIFQYKWVSGQNDEPPHAPWNYGYEIWTVEDKDTSGAPAKVTYTMHFCQLLEIISFYDYPQYYFTETDEKVSYSFPPYQVERVFYSSPDEFIPVEPNASLYYLESGYGQRLTKGDRMLYVQTSSGNNPCWEKWSYPGERYIEYTEGLGMTHERRGGSQMSGDTYYDHMLVYSQSGDDTYGSPIAASCNELMPNITLSEDTVLLSYMNGSSGSVSVFANYSNYVDNGVDCSSWVTATDFWRPGNGVITFRTLNTNEDTIQRVCVFNVEIPPEVSVPIVVIQKPYPNITLSEDSVLLSYMYGDSSSVTVFANYSYYVHSDQDCSSWVTFTDVGGPGNGRITFRTLNTNEDTIQRVCVFDVVIPPEVSVPIVVIQKPYPTAIEETGEDHFKLYPNPTTGILRINAREKISEVEVENSAGISIKGISCNSGAVTIDLSGNVPGLYLVRIKTESGVVCRKVNLLK